MDILFLFGSLLAGIVLLFLFNLLLKFFAEKAQDKTILDKGGFRIVFSNYFALFKKMGYTFRTEKIKGSSAEYYVYSNNLRVNFESKIVDKVMFTSYKIYKQEINGLKLLEASPVLRFVNAENIQNEMFLKIHLRISNDIVRLGM